MKMDKEHGKQNSLGIGGREWGCGCGDCGCGGGVGGGGGGGGGGGVGAVGVLGRNQVSEHPIDGRHLSREEHL